MERKINIHPSHLEHLGLPKDTKGIIGRDANDCPSSCENLKTDTEGKKICKAIIISVPEINT